MDQGPLGIGDRLFHGPHLLRDHQAGLSRLYHVSHGTKMLIGMLQPKDKGGTGCVDMSLRHRTTPSFLGG